MNNEATKRIRIRNLLLAGNPYDAFLLEEAGFRASGQIEPEDVPSFDFVGTAAEASNRLASGHYDMLIVDYVLPDMSGPELAQKAKLTWPNLPVAVITSNTDLGGAAKGSVGRDIPHLFIWYGAHSFLRSLIMLHEDEKNAAELVTKGHALAILLVEDEPNFYSHFIPLLYDRIRVSALELIDPTRHPQSIWEAAENRPLVLLRRNFEDACEVIYQFKTQLMAIITDMCYPVRGDLKGDAGLRLLYRARTVNAHLPVAVHSRELIHREAAHEAQAKFLWKDSPHFLTDLDHFLINYCGFGPFVFRWPAGDCYGVAHNLRELRQLIADVPEVVFEYHALHSDFSTWLAVHGYGDIARAVREQSIIDPSPRQHLLTVLDKTLRAENPANQKC